jgi:hypothetical protein
VLYPVGRGARCSGAAARMGRPVSAWLALFLVLGVVVCWLRPLREHVSLRLVVRAEGVSVSEPALVQVEGEGLGEAPEWSFEPFQVVVDSTLPLDADEGSWGTDPRDAAVDAAAPLEPEHESGSSSGADDATSLPSPGAQDAAAELAASQQEPRLDESGSSSGEDDATSSASPGAQDAAAELSASQLEPLLDESGSSSGEDDASNLASPGALYAAAELAASQLEPRLEESGSSSGEDDATSLASHGAQDAAAELAASQLEPRLDGAWLQAPADQGARQGAVRLPPRATNPMGVTNQELLLSRPRRVNQRQAQAREPAAGAGAGTSGRRRRGRLDRGSQEDRNSEQAAQEERGSQEGPGSGSGSGSPAGTHGGAQVPVVGFFYSDGAALDATHYQWATLRPAVRHGNRCFVLTNAKASVPDDLRAHVTVVPLEGLESKEMRSFKRVYRPMGYKEPFELFNVLRHFYVHEWMRREGHDWVVYLDSDVALLASTQALMQRLARAGPGCDCLVDFGLSRGADRVLWATRKWSVFVGTSALSARVLADFTAFATDIYAPQHAAVLEAKRERGTNVNDMTLWYLFAMAADQRFAADTQAPQSVLDTLPRARATHHMCHFADLDHRRSFTDPAFRYDPDTATAQLHGKPLLSVHFQGGTKYLIPRLFRLPDAVITVSRVGDPTRVFKPRGKRSKGKG